MHCLEIFYKFENTLIWNVGFLGWIYSKVENVFCLWKKKKISKSENVCKLIIWLKFEISNFNIETDKEYNFVKKF